MGLDIHAINFCRFASKRQQFGRVATLGRQALHVSADKLRSLMQTKTEVDYGKYCEDFLKVHFGATEVESFDYSSYEGATHLHDLNRQLQEDYNYDTIIDAGLTEHIFNAPQALSNISKICAPGGQILHMVPANNFCGHGFWQFSPSIFFALYSEANGYSETQVFLADVGDVDNWYEVSPFVGESMAAYDSTRGVFALVRTKRGAEFSHENVQQMEYLQAWSGQSMGNQMHSNIKGKIKNVVEETALFVPMRAVFKAFSPPSLSRNPRLERRDVKSMV